MNREIHARFRERGRVKSPPATRPADRGSKISRWQHQLILSRDPPRERWVNSTLSGFHFGGSSPSDRKPLGFQPKKKSFLIVYFWVEQLLCTAKGNEDCLCVKCLHFSFMWDSVPTRLSAGAESPITGSHAVASCRHSPCVTI